MILKIRVVLDTKEDVIRTLLIDGNSTLEDFHKVIAKVFGFNGQEMASFYRTDDEWNQGEEIPLFSMDDSPNALCMSNTTIMQNIEDPGEKLIYVYDFLSMWTFYVEVLEQTDTQEELPKLVLSIGEVPEEAPEKEFSATKKQNSSLDFDMPDNEYFNDDEFNDEFNGNFESLDDIDFDKY